MVVEEIVALARDRAVRPECFFWRTQAGAEVDLLVVEGNRVTPIEIKLGAAPDLRALSGLRSCMVDLGLRTGWVITTAKEPRDLASGIHCVPWSHVVTGKVDFGIGRAGRGGGRAG